MIQEKHHRLDPALYRGYLVVSFTACMRNRATFFTNPDRFMLANICCLRSYIIFIVMPRFTFSCLTMRICYCEGHRMPQIFSES